MQISVPFLVQVIGLCFLERVLAEGDRVHSKPLLATVSLPLLGGLGKIPLWGYHGREIFLGEPNSGALGEVEELEAGQVPGRVVEGLGGRGSGIEVHRA